MSEIPLNKLHRARNARAGYAQLDSPNGHASPARMTRSSHIAAVVAATKNTGRARREERYADDPEEEAGLLDADGEGGGFPDDNRHAEEHPVEVCSLLCWLDMQCANRCL